MKKQGVSIGASSFPLATRKTVWPTLVDPSGRVDDDGNRTLEGSGPLETSRTLEWVVWILVISSLLLAILGGTALVYGFLQIGLPLSR